MESSTKKVTKEKFIAAVNMATTVIHKLHPRTKLAYYCEEFLELNEKILNEYKAAHKKITDPIYKKLRKVRIDNAVEKDGILIMTGKDGDRYSYNKSGEEAVLAAQDKLDEELIEATKPFLAQEIVVKCIVSKLDLPKEILVETEKVLNGFVFQNKNEFKEKIDHLK